MRIARVERELLPASQSQSVRQHRRCPPFPAEIMDSKNDQPALDPSVPIVSSAPTPDSPLNEDLALSLLKCADLPAADIKQLTLNPALMKSRKVRLAIASHGRSSPTRIHRFGRDVRADARRKVSLISPRRAFRTSGANASGSASYAGSGRRVA